MAILSIVLAVAALAPSPTPSPLKTIERVHSSPFCTALKQNIGPAVRSILENHDAIVSGKSILLQMARDLTYRTNRQMVIDSDLVKVDKAVGDIVRNLAVLDKALNELEHIPNHPQTDADRRLIAMRQQLRDAADQQRSILNVFSGLYESYTSNELGGKANPLAGALRQGASNEDVTTLPIAPITQNPAVASRPSSPPAPSPDLAGASPVPARPTPVPEIDLGLAGQTKAGRAYTRLFNTVTTFQIHEQAIEAQAAQAIVAAAADCSNSGTK